MMNTTYIIHLLIPGLQICLESPNSTKIYRCVNISMGSSELQSPALKRQNTQWWITVLNIRKYRIRSRIEDLKKLAKEVDIFFTKFGSKITAYVHPMIVGTRSSVLHRPSQAGCSGIANTTTVFKRQQRSGFNSKAFKPAQKPRGFKLGFPIELVTKELNHLAAILHVYAGGLNFMK